MTLFNISKNSENSHSYNKSHEFRAEKIFFFYKDNPLILYLNLFCKVPAAHQCPNSQEPNLCYCSICGLRNMFVSRHKAVLEQTNLNWNANIYFKPINWSFHGHFTLGSFWRIYLSSDYLFSRYHFFSEAINWSTSTFLLPVPSAEEKMPAVGWGKLAPRFLLC